MLPSLFGLGAGALGAQGPQSFEQQYNCFSVAFIDRPHLEEGDKILLPQSAFDVLARMNVDFPMLFELSNPAMGRRTHCGVLEFTAEEGKCFIPFWMMQNLMLAEGSIINVKNVSLLKATYVKFRPQRSDFLDISNPRAVLEKKLRSFSCVTVGDHLCINYLDKNYYLEITEVKPGDAASIIETDCNVDFDAPADYKEPSAAAAEEAARSVKPRVLQKAKIEDPDAADEKSSFVAFGGGARRIDNKPLPQSKDESEPKGVAESKGAAPKSSSSSSSSSSSLGGSTSKPPVAQAKHSKIAGKYSKTSKLGAFTGTGRSLS